MYSPRLYKYRDSYVLYKPTVHTFGTVTLHKLFWYRHTHMTFPPPDCTANLQILKPACVIYFMYIVYYIPDILVL